jgi:murein DD-endopeptidase MepM/ murein hydrolase activator NlpD
MFSIDELVGGVPWEISQPFGKTYWSTHGGLSLYTYGVVYGLEEGAHPGVDIGIPVRTPLYSPVAGEVMLAGGTPVFSNILGGATSQTGQLKIRLANGDQVILGHMRRIDVQPGAQLTTGQYVGLSGHNNGPHVHVELRVKDTGASAGFRIVNPMGVILSETSAPQPAALRFFRVALEDHSELRSLPVYDQPRVEGEIRGEYQNGEIVPCHTVVQAQQIEPGERAWGQISGATFADRWAYLGYTREVRPGESGLDLYVVTTTVKNSRTAPDSAHPPVGSYPSGAILPIVEVVEGEEVDPGEKAWGRLAHGPFVGQWAFLGSNSTHKLR